MLGGYAKFLQDKDLALNKHQPYLVRWVRDFLLFTRAHAGYSFEQTLDLFLAEVGGRVGTKPWQLQQASDAIRIYRYQYRGAKAGDGDSPTARAFVDDAARLVCFCRVGAEGDVGPTSCGCNPERFAFDQVTQVMHTI